MPTSDLNNYLANANITTVVPGAPTVGAIGGWFMGGGHSQFTSMFGLGADQILSLEVVTADGRFITVDPVNNKDLFWALRGGGGSKLFISLVKIRAHIPTRHLGRCYFGNPKNL